MQSQISPVPATESMNEPFQLRHPGVIVGIIAFIVSVVLFAILAFTFPIPSYPRHCCYFGPVKIAGVPPIDLTSNASFCFLHDTPIYTKSVPIVYGLPEGPFPSEQDLRKFPFGSTWVSGGCCVDIYKYALVSQCSKCVALRQRWNSEHHRLPSDRKYNYLRPMPAMPTPTVSFDEMILPCYVIE